MELQNKTGRLAVLSLSGGMDSTSLLIRLLAERYDEIHCYSFFYGQKHSIETDKARHNMHYLCLYPDLASRLFFTELDLRQIFEGSQSALTSLGMEIPEGHYAEENMKSTVVENRNAIFSNIIFGKALALYKKKKKDVDICLGLHSGDHSIYPDCTPQFRDAMELAMRLGNYDSEHVSYYTPFMEGNKTTILQDCLQCCDILEIDFDTVLSNTITSYNPDSEGRSSGKSGSDVERVEAFMNIGRKDPIPYQMPWEEVVEHAKSVLGR